MKDIVLDVRTLSKWLSEAKPVTIVDVRPEAQRSDWFIQGSTHIDVYEALKSGDPNAMSSVDLDKEMPVVTVCAAGKMSQIAAKQLRKLGYQAFSLESGMEGWSIAWSDATMQLENCQIIQLRRGKGCLSYIVESACNAFVIDASLPVQVYYDIVRKNKWKLAGVLDTHIHADHLSRSRQLAVQTGSPLYLPRNSKVQFQHISVTPEQSITIGNVQLKIFETPGHSFDHIALQLEDRVLFSGDTLFINSVGRPDLKSSESETRLKSELLYDTVQRLLALDGNIMVLPGHTSLPVAFDGKIVGEKLALIKDKTPIAQLPKQEFIQIVSKKNHPTPPNYEIIVKHNMSGEFEEGNAAQLEAGANRCAI
jgi:glyoxylase-like metal-dependent hydrolase (beta-lactamase superfamily II)/rhodanese-related sulfurtransferase